jgi:hypothetical protein
MQKGLAMGIRVSVPVPALNHLFAEAGQLGRLAETYQLEGHPAAHSLGQACQALTQLTPR